jgi:hypothetical protein
MLLVISVQTNANNMAIRLLSNDGMSGIGDVAFLRHTEYRFQMLLKETNLKHDTGLYK